MRHRRSTHNRGSFRLLLPARLYSFRRMNKRMFCSAFAAVVYSIFSNNKLSDQCHLYYTLRFWFCQAKRGTYNFVAVRADPFPISSFSPLGKRIFTLLFIITFLKQKCDGKRRKKFPQTRKTGFFSCTTFQNEKCDIKTEELFIKSFYGQKDLKKP